MNKKFLVLLIPVLCMLLSGASDRRRRSQRVHQNPYINPVTETERFDFSPWTDIGGGTPTARKIIANEIEGPLGGTWAQEWVATTTTGSHILYYNRSNDMYWAKKNVLSIYLKKRDAGNYHYFKISLYNGSGHARGAWMWNGSAWVEYEGDADVEATGQEDVGNGWWRVWIRVDGETFATIGNGYIRPYIYITGDGSHEDQGNHFFGMQLDQGEDIYGPRKYRLGEGATACVPTNIVKRGKPNDFWAVHDFASPSSDGTCPDGFVGHANNDISDALWYLGDDYMDMVRAWGIQTHSDVGVAVLDIEVNNLHYDLFDQCQLNDLEINGVDGVDDDGNGLVDDKYGYDYMGKDPNPGLSIAEDGNFNTGATWQHGTQMASLIGSTGNNENYDCAPSTQGGVGVLWDVPIMALRTKVGSGSYDPAEKTLDNLYYWVVPYMDWINGLYGVNYKVVNMSYIMGNVSPNVTARHLVSRGYIPVTGAGNSNVLNDGWASIDDSLFVASAINKQYKTGNQNNGTNETTNFGTSTTICMYASKSATNASNDGITWSPRSSASTGSKFYTAGYKKSSMDIPTLEWENNFSIGSHAGMDDGIMPTPALTSGATAQLSGMISYLMDVLEPASLEELVGAIERGAVTDIYQYNTDQCRNGDCRGGWVSYTNGLDITIGERVNYPPTDSAIQYVALSTGTTVGSNPTVDTGVTWAEHPDIPWSEPSLWQSGQPYVEDDFVRDSSGDYFFCHTAGTSAGNDSDLDGGSDTGVGWYLIEIPYDYSTTGFLGIGRGNAYRAATLWGTVADTTLSGTVYVSGDVHFTGITQITANTVFKIAPRDIYEDEIEVNQDCQSKYLITGLTTTNPKPPENNLVEIYFSGTTIMSGTITFESNAVTPDLDDWGGIWKQSGALIIGDTGIVTNNTQMGDY